MAMTIQEFGQSIKQKYPQYANVDDSQLGQRMLEKYPQYADRVQVAAKKAPVSGVVENVTNPIAEGVKAVGNFVLPRTTNVLKQAAYGASVGKAANGLGQVDQDRFQQAQDLTARAKQETDPKLKDLYLNQARQIMGESGQEIGQLVGGAESDLNIGTKGQLPSALRSALGMSGELGVTFAPVGVLGKGQNALQRTAIAAAEGGARGGIYGLTTPEGGAGEVLKKALGGLLGGAIIGGGVQGAGELVRKAAGGLKKGGDSLIASQYNVSRGQGNANRLKDTVGELADYGISTIDDVQKAADKVTGKEGVITKLTRDAVGRADDVNIDSAYDVAQNIVNDPGLPVGQDQKLLKQFTTDLQKLRGKSSPTDPAKIGTVNPLDLFDLIKDYESKAASYLRYRPDRAVANPSDEALGKAYKMMAEELKDRLFVDAGADKAAASIANNPKLLEELASISPKLAEKAKSATTVGELRSLAAPFVRGSNLADATDAAAQMATQNLGNQGTGLGRYVQNFHLLKPLSWLPIEQIASSRAVNAGAGKALRGVGRAAQSGAAERALQILSQLAAIQGGRAGEQANATRSQTP